MSFNWYVLAAAFLASGVEFIETATILLAVGTVRGWRDTFAGAGAAFGILAAIVGVFALLLKGITVTNLVPLPTVLNVLHVVAGVLLLWFGFTWLNKALRTYMGLKHAKSEDEEYAKEVARLRGEETNPLKRLDWVAFVTSFKGTFLEGTEVIFIVLPLAADPQTLAPAVIGATLAAAATIVITLAVHKPISAVPRPVVKFVTGLLLVTFGTFWLGEGLTLWHADLLILLFLVVYLAISLAVGETGKRMVARRG